MEGREEKKQDFVQVLSAEISRIPFLFLRENEVGKARLVSHRWNSLLSDDYFWQQRYERFFPVEAEALKKENEKNRSISQIEAEALEKENEEKKSTSKKWFELYTAKIVDIKESIKDLPQSARDLFWAFWLGEWRWVKEQIEKNPEFVYSNLLYLDEKGRSLFNLPRFINSEEFQIWLFKKYKNDEQLKSCGITSWSWAVLCRREEVIRGTMDNGISDEEGFNPKIFNFYQNIIGGNETGIGVMSTSRFYQDITDEDNIKVSTLSCSSMSSLHFAVFVNHLGIVRILLTKSFDFDVGKAVPLGSLGGCTSLDIAARYGYLEVIQEILIHSKDNEDFENALSEAVENKQTRIVELFLTAPEIKQKISGSYHPTFD